MKFSFVSNNIRTSIQDFDIIQINIITIVENKYSIYI